ncbi:MAG: hypothetical protein EG823_07430 [Actinobacteria bacterium]|nr:hypothetical protein [Actinomycetota bacterium]
MSLSRALSILPDDEHTERVLRDVLVLFGHHQKEWMSEGEVQARTGRTRVDIHAVLPVLSTCYVLDFDSDKQSYRYSGDVVLGFEIDTFMRRAEHHQNHMRANLARFRERQNY